MTTELEFNKLFINNLDNIYKYGFIIDNKLYKFNKIITIYIKEMKLKFNALGKTYIQNMIQNVQTIFNNVNLYSKYDNLEYVNNILNYCIKMIEHNHKKINILPILPDYTLDEIRDISCNL